LLGFGRTDLKTNKDGRRMDTYTGYIKPILNRPNFKVIRYAHVHKIELDESNTATGVTYKRNGEMISVKARREVIISAGAINSPQLLMLSGIGALEHLKSVGVKDDALQHLFRISPQTHSNRLKIFFKVLLFQMF